MTALYEGARLWLQVLVVIAVLGGLGLWLDDHDYFYDDLHTEESK